MKKNRAKVQAFGGFLTAMVIPNMGAFIAWGFITAFFIPTGWLPNEQFANIVSPMSKYLLPVLLAYSGGKLVYGERGGIAGTIGTIGLIIGADIPMFMGAMLMGPLSAFCVKKFDGFIEKKVPSGFEMVINNFALGIIGFILCLLSYAFIGPIILAANNGLTVIIQKIVDLGVTPLLAVINEPAKVLFLNNVIDQGIYYPLGMQEALVYGKSIFFTVASNPGSGLGLLLAYSLFGKGDAKKTAPGAIIIHFFGGIHEIYFPYVLMKPITIIGMISGSICGIITFSLFGAGLVAGPSPGSIFSYLALTPRGNFIGIIAGVAVATGVSFLVNSFLLKVSKEKVEGNSIESYREHSQAMKQEGKDILKDTIEGTPNALLKTKNEKIMFIVFACDAGLGSSAMGASAFRKRLEKSGLTIEVKHFSLEKVPSDADVIVIHKNLLDRAQMANPGMRIITIENYMKDKSLDALAEEIITRNQ